MGNIECQLPPQNEGIGSKFARLVHLKPSKETEFSTYTLACDIKTQLINSGKKKAFTPADEKELRDYASQGLKYGLNAKELSSLYVIAKDVNANKNYVKGKDEQVTAEVLIKTLFLNHTPLNVELGRMGHDFLPTFVNDQTKLVEYYRKNDPKYESPDHRRNERILEIGTEFIGLEKQGQKKPDKPEVPGAILDKIAKKNQDDGVVLDGVGKKK